ncbi:MAG: glycosyltransferase family 2 protein [Planctomycetota bacterium]|nr:glycosyltransferase family 2 protein [Planctomycetota bacterium]
MHKRGVGSDSPMSTGGTHSTANPERALLHDLREGLRRVRPTPGWAIGYTAAPDVERFAAEDEAREKWLNTAPPEGRSTVAAVMVSFNKKEWVEKNLQALRRQTVPFDRIIVVDNDSQDGSPAMIRSEFPEVDLIVMPHSGYGACETFNIGFKNADTDLIAILDDDVQLCEDWVELTLGRIVDEPPSTAMISTRVVEPGMPEWFLNHPDVHQERYMATFRGCATLARRDVLELCGYYDEAFFIYGNERDLSARVMNAGYRILQYPTAWCHHGTPFGMKAGPRSLYYHVRNLWWYLFKHVAVWQIVYFFALQVMHKFRPRNEQVRADAVGTIGIFSVIRETRGGWWIVLKATGAAFWGLPRCWRQRRVCRHPDFALPTK